MYNREVLCIDLDDVTADLNTEAIYLHNKENPKNIIYPSDLTCWNGNWELLKDYYTKEGIYSKLSVIKGSIDVLKELSNYYHILFVTASPTPNATLEKLNWVDKHFPFIGSRNVIATPYKYLIKGKLLFDDSPEFLPKFNGLRVLMERLHNSHLIEEKDYDAKVSDWYGFYDVIKSFENNCLLRCEKSVG